MFSKTYFSYLLRSNKYLLLFISLITVLNLLGNKDSSLAMVISCFIATVMAYGMPFIIFYFVHDKKAIDTYFSIPVSRKEILFSSLAFCILTTALPYAIGSVAFGISKGLSTVLILAYVLVALVTISALVSFNAMIYLLADNALDGAIMIAAYTVLPLSLFICISAFLSTYVCGMNIIPLDFLTYLSPVYMFVHSAVEYADKTIDFVSTIVCAIITVVSVIVLYKEFVDRKVERASTTSEGFFTYPFIIAVYVMLTMISINSFYTYQYDNIFKYLSDYFFIYLLLFAVFVAAHFIYRRKLYFDYKLPLYFVIVLVLSLLITVAARNTDCFGLSDSYTKNDRYGYYCLNEWCDYNSEMFNFIKNKTNDNTSYVGIYIEAGNNRLDQQIDEETAEVFEKLRREAIEKFYNDYEAYYNSDNASMGISSIYKGQENTYSYQIRSLKPDELLKLAKDNHCTVTISTDYGEYVMDSKGDLHLWNAYAY
ncbi:MAG: hypothetical protein IJI66_09410 [Erysipelotrichaceae bacterium]|nr:hypothetical protein [Erysipelotrichaceae bacterium]